MTQYLGHGSVAHRTYRDATTNAVLYLRDAYDVPVSYTEIAVFVPEEAAALPSRRRPSRCPVERPFGLLGHVQPHCSGTLRRPAGRLGQRHDGPQELGYGRFG